MPSRTESALRRFAAAHRFALAAFATLAIATPVRAIDHAPFDALLRAHVKNGVVDYPGFQESREFKAYVEELAKPVAFASKADELAFNINAYNALAIQGILDGLSPSSFIGRARYFKIQEWSLAGRRITLYDLEHKVLRPMGEPRIHFAIICASRSCPFLRSEAYSAAKLDRQLDEQARQFVNDPFRNRFDKTAKVAQLSEIFKWFDEDFRGAGSVQRTIAKFVADPDVAKGLAQDGYKVEWIDYDWNLNGTPPRR
ncbi:MAG: DUF547 domain-containing protein [Burkholderiales bacterium]